MFPAAARQLVVGERLARARKRRRLTQHTLAVRAGISIPTLRKLKMGDAGVSLTTALRVLQVLGLAADIDELAGRRGRPSFARPSAEGPTSRAAKAAAGKGSTEVVGLSSSALTK